VSAVAFSPDGKRLAAGGGDLRVWDVGTWHQVLATGRRGQGASGGVRPGGGAVLIVGPHGRVARLAFSPDSKRLAGGGLDTAEVALWDLETGQELRRLRGHKGSGGITALAFSADGKRLASAGYDRTVRLWDAETGAAVHVCRGHTGRVGSLAFTPDGRRLASVGANATGEGATLKLWNTQTGRETLSLKVKGCAIAFSADGRRLLLVGEGDTVRFLDATLRQKEHTVRGTGGLAAVAFSPDGKLLACGSGVTAPESDEVRVLDAATGQVQFVFEMAPGREWAGQGRLAALAFSPDSIRLAALDGEGTLKVWDMRTEQELLKLQRNDPTFHQARPIHCLAFSPDFKFLAGGGQGLQLWDVATGAEVRTLPTAGEVTGLAFSPDGARVAVVGGFTGVQICEVATGRVLVTIKKETVTRRNTVAFSPDSAYVAGAESKTVQVWDAHRGTVVATLSGHTGDVWSVAFSPDGKRLASAGADGSVRVWDLATRQMVQTLRGHAGFVNQVVFSPSGQRVASASDDGTVRVWDLENGR
jgi:WD40 repeat protein